MLSSESSARGSAMGRKTTFQSISKRAHLLLTSGETKDVDYKENVRGLHADDLVAFANSTAGGAILIGVRESKSPTGKQKGEPIGHPITDEARLQIMSKALSCSPPINIEIIAENLAHKPFYRIEVPGSGRRPYSTSSGTYKIREYGRNNPLLPEQLLAIFLEREADEFRNRFAAATEALESRMSDTLALVSQIEDIVSRKIQEIGNQLGWAEYKAGDAVDTIEAVQAQVNGLAREMSKQARRIRAVVKKLDAEDPVKDDIERETLDSLVQQLRANPKIRDAIVRRERPSIGGLTVPADAVRELDKDELSRLVSKALKQVLDERS